MTHLEKVCSGVMPTVDILGEISSQQEFEDDPAFYELLNVVLKMGMEAFNDLYEYWRILGDILVNESDAKVYAVFKESSYTLVDHA